MLDQLTFLWFVHTCNLGHLTTGPQEALRNTVKAISKMVRMHQDIQHCHIPVSRLCMDHIAKSSSTWVTAQVLIAYYRQYTFWFHAMPTTHDLAQHLGHSIGLVPCHRLGQNESSFECDVKNGKKLASDLNQSMRIQVHWPCACGRVPTCTWTGCVSNGMRLYTNYLSKIRLTKVVSPLSHTQLYI